MAYYGYGQYGNRLRVQDVEEPQETQRSYQKQNDATIVMGRDTGRRTSPVKIIVTAIVAFALLGAVIYSHVMQLQISNDIALKQREYTQLQSDNVRMQSEIAGRASNKKIQEYAENVLGMRTIDASQVEYVMIQTDDVVEIPVEEQNVFVKIKTWFDQFVEYLRG